jgi:hypothetical protein
MRHSIWAAVLAVGVLAGAVAFGGIAGAEPVVETFEYTGGPQELSVPAGVCQVAVDAFGAGGGDGQPAGDQLGFGAPGGRATATLAVTPGEVLQVNVGGQGADGAAGTGGTGGFNGGGDGGDGPNAGAGGGGASDVRRGASALVIAAGGGGGGGGGQDPPLMSGDGGAGGEFGEDGGDIQNGATGGLSGGNGGTGGLNGGGDGGPGFGGDGGDADGKGSFQGGGGGGAGATGGGGGGSSIELNGGGGGGGGSSLGPAGVTFETGVQDGDGVVTITYDLAAGGCPPVPVVVAPRFTG